MKLYAGGVQQTGWPRPLLLIENNLKQIHMKKILTIALVAILAAGCTEKEETPEPPRIAFPVTVAKPRHGVDGKTKSDTTMVADTTRKLKRGVNIINK